MRKVIFIFSITFFTHSQVNAQNTIDLRKHIVVTGSAEKKVAPDEIVLEIILNSHYDHRHLKLDSVEKNFKKILKKNNIDLKKISLDESNNYYYWWYWWSDYRHYPHRTRFKLKLDHKTDFLSLVKDLNQKWVQSIRIVSSSNKNITEHRKEVKKEAVKAAKDKAQYLLEALDENIGEVLSLEEIQENSNQYNYWYGYRSQNLLSNSVIPSSNSGEEVKSVTMIKLRYEFKVKFAIE